MNAVITALSSAKDYHKFFQGLLSDGDQWGGFEKGHTRQLQEIFMQKQVRVTLRNCQISLNKTSGKPQVVIKSYTVVKQSKTTTFNIPNPKTLGSPVVPINQLNTIDQYNRATLRIAVLKLRNQK